MISLLRCQILVVSRSSDLWMLETAYLEVKMSGLTPWKWTVLHFDRFRSLKLPTFHLDSCSFQARPYDFNCKISIIYKLCFLVPFDRFDGGMIGFRGGSYCIDTVVGSELKRWIEP